MGNSKISMQALHKAISSLTNKQVRELLIDKLFKLSEAGLLSDDEKVRACLLAKNAGADFVKSSTGFMAGGATTEDVFLMRKTVGSHLGVKAAGGIRTLAQAMAMIEAGANRIGTSAGVSIIAEIP